MIPFSDGFKRTIRVLFIVAAFGCLAIGGIARDIDIWTRRNEHGQRFEFVEVSPMRVIVRIHFASAYPTVIIESPNGSTHMKWWDGKGWVTLIKDKDTGRVQVYNDEPMPGDRSL